MIRQICVVAFVSLSCARVSFAQIEYSKQERFVMAKAGGKPANYIYAPDFGPWKAEIKEQGDLGNWGYASQGSSYNADGVDVHELAKAQGGNQQQGGQGQSYLIVQFAVQTDSACHIKGLWNIDAGGFSTYEATIELKSGGNTIFVWSHTQYTNPYESGQFPFAFDGPLPAGQYQLRAYSYCQSSTPQGKSSVGLDASLVVADCSPDCDASGELDIDDFICFQTLFGLGDAGADCDQSGELDIDDFICFQTAFGLGCP